MPADTPEMTREFVETMVDRVINELGKKFEELDISLDYIAAAILDDSAIGISSRQQQMGRFAKLPPTSSRRRISRLGRESDDE